MPRQLEEKVALVTGGSMGIGHATALLFAREGAKVVIADILVEDGEETVRMIKEAGGEAIFVKTDVSKAAEVEALIKKAVASYGRLDCAFNNAGIDGEQAPLADCTEENWDRVMSINLKGVWLCMKYEIPQMLKQGGGSIVNMGSVASLVGMPYSHPVYNASKGGVLLLTRAAVMDYGTTGIRFNALCPGFILTPMVEDVIEKGGSGSEAMIAEFNALHPMGRIGKPEEIAAAALWLCSDASSFVTGAPIVVDGGYTAQ